MLPPTLPPITPPYTIMTTPKDLRLHAPIKYEEVFSDRIIDNRLEMTMITGRIVIVFLEDIRTITIKNKE